MIQKEAKVEKGEETPREGTTGVEAEFSRKLLGCKPCCFLAILSLKFPSDRTRVRILKWALFRELRKALLHLCPFSLSGAWWLFSYGWVWISPLNCRTSGKWNIVNLGSIVLPPLSQVALSHRVKVTMTHASIAWHPQGLPNRDANI